MFVGRKTTLAIFFLDVLSLVVAFNAMSLARGFYAFNGLIIAPLMVPCGLLIVALYLIDGYKLRTDMLSLDYTSQHMIAVISALLATLLITFAVIPSGYPLQQSRLVIALSFLIVAPVNLGYRRFLYSYHLRRRQRSSLVFLGDRASALDFREECALAGMTQPIIEVLPQKAGLPEPSATSMSFTRLMEELRNGRINVEAIVLRESNHDIIPETSQQLIDLYFSGVPSYTLELFHQVYWRKIPLYRLNQTWLFQEGFEIAREPVYERLKRISDIFLSMIGIILAAPAVAVAALAIWTEDRGPVFFKQVRIGKNRVPFTVYKLRTMRQNVTGIPYAQHADNRITRVGRFLRMSRIDEFPQLLNVFNGDMSLIGPRAEWDRLVADYEKQISCYHFRHLVRPGITGWAQVNYPYGATIEDTLRKLEYDLYYIRHFSFRLDASIILKTLHVMLFGKGR